MAKVFFGFSGIYKNEKMNINVFNLKEEFIKNLFIMH